MFQGPFPGLPGNGHTATRMAGVEKATIDECLAHAGDMRMADLYIEKDWRIINDGARMALSLIRWEKRP